MCRSIRRTLPSGSLHAARQRRTAGADAGSRCWAGGAGAGGGGSAIEAWRLDAAEAAASDEDGENLGLSVHPVVWPT